VDFAKLKAGQKLQIPPAPAPGAAGLGFKEPGHAGNAAAIDGSVHVVKAGETLTQIAKQRHTTAKAIQSANGLKTTRLLVGQKLRLPAAGQPAAASETTKPPGQPTRSTLAEM
jgi:membrane-bound lytic murein transglycosylase D